MLARVCTLSGLAAAVVAALLAVPRIGAAQTLPVQPAGSSGGISVVGQGIVLAQPNTAHVTLGVEVTDPSLANAQADASRRMDAVVAQLKSAGIPDTDIRTVSYTVNPQYDNSGALRGYQVLNLVDVKTGNVGGLGGLIDSAVNAGATRIYGISFQSDDMDTLKAQARDQAMQNARAKAEQLARDSGVTLGRPVLVDESDTSGVTPVRAPAPAAASGAMAVPTTPIQSGELQVSTTVHVVWAIQ